MYRTGSICPACVTGRLKATEKNLEFEYKGEKVVVADQKVFACNVCPEEFMNCTQSRKLEKLLTDHRRRVDHLLTSEEIKAIRTSLGFSQTAMAKILGVGEKNFARYETGQVTQSRITDHFLRAIDRHPFILEIIHKEDMESIAEFSAVLKEYRAEGKEYIISMDVEECAIGAA
jgi:HTH-type transcriptional regulator/antitoxin MqsA